jgi:TonB family protein
MFTFLRPLGAGLIVLLTCLGAAAEQPSDLLPPVAESRTDVPYPQGAEGDAAVLLELVVEKDGSVSSATVVDGVEPFAEQARNAALTWRFAPAQRAQRPVAARIRARVDFHREPEAPPAEAALPAPPAAPAATGEAAAKPSTPPSMEITVVGARREIGQTTLSKSDVREMPGAFGDAFRAIEALPGVAPVVSGMPYFYVRGAPPNNAGYYVDGVRVPLLFHLGIGQSVIHPGLVDHVDFFPSAAPARYGYFAGAIIAGQTREPATTLHGEANVRIVDAGALLEAPFASGRGSALVAGRYGYPGPIVALATDEMKIGYWDYQARTTWKLSSKGTLGLFAFGSHDYLASRSPSNDPEARDELVEEFVSDFHRLDLRFDQAWTDGRARIALTGGYDSQGAAPTYLTNKSLAMRLEFEQKLSQQLLFRGGADAQRDAYRIRLSAQGPGEPVVPQSANPPPTNLTAGLHADVVWRIARRVELVPGARFNVFSSSRPRESPNTGRVETLIPAIDPRISARVTVSPGVAWLASFGLSHQYPSLRLGEIPRTSNRTP